MTRTYVDSGVLIAAARGSSDVAIRALQVLGEHASREFVCSDYVRFEVLPKPTYFNRIAEIRFYEAFFSTARIWMPSEHYQLELAYEEACHNGLSWPDALHVVVAALAECEELITTEKPGSSIHRTNRLRVVSIDV